MGEGPMTGRGAGYCAGYTAPGYANQAYGWGRGFRRGGGFGRGWRNRAYQPYAPGPAWYGPPPAMTREQETEMLRDQARDLQDALERINDRLNKLDKE